VGFGVALFSEPHGYRGGARSPQVSLGEQKDALSQARPPRLALDTLQKSVCVWSTYMFRLHRKRERERERERCIYIYISEIICIYTHVWRYLHRCDNI
jgi:hypothetical protein